MVERIGVGACVALGVLCATVGAPAGTRSARGVLVGVRTGASLSTSSPGRSERRGPMEVEFGELLWRGPRVVAGLELEALNLQPLGTVGYVLCGLLGGAPFAAGYGPDGTLLGVRPQLAELEDAFRPSSVTRSMVRGLDRAGPFGGIESLARGLVGYYRLDEVPGTRIAVNEVGPDAARRKTIPSVQGIRRRAIDLDGYWANFVDTKTAIGAETTVSFWMKPSASSNVWGTQSITSLRTGYWVQYDMANEILVVWYWFHGGIQSDLQADLQAGVALNPGGWIHVVFTVDSANVPRVFANGIEAAYPSTSWSLVPTEHNRPLVIGRADWGSTISAFRGALDEIAVWDHALSPEEVKLLYRDGKGRTY